MNTSLLRPSLRAALVVSGLSVASGCGAGSTPESTTPHERNANENPQVATTDPALTPDEHCTGSWSEYSEACCAREPDTTWSAAEGCVSAVMVGPFVPPEMNA